MEDRQLPITVGPGAGARVVTLDLPPFTLIGATTRAGLLTTPLRDRFGIQHRLEHYDPDDLAAHRRPLRARPRRSRSSRRAPARSPSAARGTPRVANRLLKRVRDFAEVRGGGHIDADTADAALDLLEVDDEGLDRLDREILDGDLRPLRRRPGRPLDARGRGRRGGRHDRGRLRALPAPARLPQAHAARPLRDRARVRAPRARAARRPRACF